MGYERILIFKFLLFIYFNFYFVLFWLRGWWFDKNAGQLTSNPRSTDEVTVSGMWLQTHKCEHSFWTCLHLTSISLSYGEARGDLSFLGRNIFWECVTHLFLFLWQNSWHSIRAELITLVYGFRGFSSGSLGPNPMAAVGAYGREQLLTSWRTGSRGHNRRDQGHNIHMDSPHSRHGLLPSSWSHILKFPELHCYQIESKHLTNEPKQDISY